MALRVLQLSDPHLSRKRPLFQWNWEVAIGEVGRRNPALAVVSGDLCLDGANDPDDLACAAEQCARLPAPWKAIPGNHDVGDGPEHPGGRDPITPRRLANWRAAFGPDWWRVDLEGWRIAGLNAHLLASGLEAEEEQADFVTEQVARADRPVLLFLHVPPFALEPEEAATGAGLAPLQRAALSRLLAGAPVAALGCGHVHQALETVWEGRKVVWAPSTSMITRLGFWASLPGRHATGLVEWTLTEDGRALSRVHHPPLFMEYDVTNWTRGGGYGRMLQHPFPAPLQPQR